MKISLESDGDFTATTKWLESITRVSSDSVLQKLGREGVIALSEATPVGTTGETAGSWKYSIERMSNGIELSFTNSAHPEASVSIAKIVDSGHGTRNGGYVPPRPYIRRAMENIFRTAGDKIVKEVLDVSSN